VLLLLELKLLLLFVELTDEALPFIEPDVPVFAVE
jgi:hypothetical protein